MLPSKVKNLYKLLLANILVFLAAAIVIEFCGQIYVFFHPAYKVIPFTPDPILGWRFIPNSKHIHTSVYWYAREFSNQVKINSHGFRDFERTIKKDENTIRIALLGDSMVAARELNFAKTAGQVLEKRLNKNFGTKTGKKYEVLNFGVDGYGIDQMYLTWDFYASKFNPDFIFIYIFEKNYLRTISTLWCQEGFLGIANLGSGNCLSVRPLAIVKEELPTEFSIEEEKNFLLDYLYINAIDLNRITRNFNIFFEISRLPFQILDPADYDLFVKKQSLYLQNNMNGKRTVKMERRSFFLSFALNLKEKTKKLSNRIKEEERWKTFPHYTSGNKNDFPSWMTTNLVNLKTLQLLGEKITNAKNDFVIIDSFQFHNKSIPPTQFASNKLNILSQYFNFGYIPLYKKLDASMDQGKSPRWAYDPHLNETGNEIFANSMFDYLETKLN